MTTKTDYEQAEWETLEFAPLLITNWIGGADATIGRVPPRNVEIDQAEVEALLKELQEAELHTTPLVGEVLFSVTNDFLGFLSRYQSDPRAVDEGLSQVADVLDAHSPPDEAQAFKAAMIGIGVEVAKASEEVLGRPVSLEEEGALAFAAAVLRVAPP